MIIHQHLSPEHWFTFSLFEQLANIGCDIARASRWKKKGNSEYSEQAFERALELIDLTVVDPKNRKRLKEILRVREALIDFFVYDNQYNSTDEAWEKYFFAYSYAAALKRGL
ncbi:hypothetical protein H0W26_02420 [Candidatus Dependentiae bacterium]|nr:hypothetical protein [Candidatus Dependentiae bacterium]